MSLREQAAADLRKILEDKDGGFGWDITITSPSPQLRSADMIGFSNDVAFVIDPETGTAVTGRTASVALPLKALEDAGLGIPVNIADAGRRPWTVTFKDISGKPHTFKINEGKPDRSIGCVVCTLETYQ